LRVRQISGFRATRVESIAIAANGSRLFAGTSDGVLTMFEVRGHSPHARTENVELVQISQLLGARSTANRKPVLSLVVVDEWRALLCLADSFLTVVSGCEETFHVISFVYILLTLCPALFSEFRSTTSTHVVS
jgi:hypothetical protein